LDETRKIIEVRGAQSITGNTKKRKEQSEKGKETDFPLKFRTGASYGLCTSLRKGSLSVSQIGKGGRKRGWNPKTLRTYKKTGVTKKWLNRRPVPRGTLPVPTENTEPVKEKKKKQMELRVTRRIFKPCIEGGESPVSG